MRKFTWVLVPTLAVLAWLPTARAAEPITLRPGQCILIGSQQVCAMATDQVLPAAKTSKTLYLCRYAIHAGSEIPDLKSHALFMVDISGGQKVETLVKIFGISDADKLACEAEAKRREAEDKADAKAAKG